MKIIKAPKFEVCTCEKCGTVFEVEQGDHLYCQFDKAGIEIEKYFANCPTCDSYVKLQKQGEQNET